MNLCSRRVSTIILRFSLSLSPSFSLSLSLFLSLSLSLSIYLYLCLTLSPCVSLSLLVSHSRPSSLRSPYFSWSLDYILIFVPFSLYPFSFIIPIVQSLLSDPNPASPANAEASQLYERDRGYDILYFHLKGLEIIFASCLCPYLCLCLIFPSSLPLFFFLSFSFSPIFLSQSCFPILVCVFGLFYTFLSSLVISSPLFACYVFPYPLLFSLLSSCNLYHSPLLSSSYLFFPLLS